MINSNYWKWLYAWDVYMANYDQYGYDLGLTNTAGSLQPMDVGHDGGGETYSAKNRKFAFELSAIFGSGTNELTVNDYNLSNDISSNITINSVNCTSSGTENGLHRTIAISGSNTSEQAITIRQVGITKNIYSNSGNRNSYVMMGAFNLASPITVQPNDQFIINIEWTEE